MISDVIYPSPQGEICPGPSPFVILRLPPLSRPFRGSRERKSNAFEIAPRPFFFFAPLADTLEIDDRRETRGYFWRARGNAISYLARFSQLDVIFHACLVVRAESRESPSPLNITAFLQHASKSCKTILEEEEEEKDRFGGGKREIR